MGLDAMFTGIIKETGQLKKKIPHGSRGISFDIESKNLLPAPASSIAVNGVCLTVTRCEKSNFTVDIIPETLSRTNLGKLHLDAALNLEPSMKLNDRFDGHFVSGHIDATAKVLKRGKIQHGVWLVIELPKKLTPFIAEKGSVAINGVSLAVASVAADRFTVALIPYTQKHTNLGKLKSGDSVNIEVDIIARYLAHFYENRHHRLKI